MPSHYPEVHGCGRRGKTLLVRGDGLDLDAKSLGEALWWVDWFLVEDISTHVLLPAAHEVDTFPLDWGATTTLGHKY